MHSLRSGLLVVAAVAVALAVADRAVAGVLPLPAAQDVESAVVATPVDPRLVWVGVDGQLRSAVLGEAPRTYPMPVPAYPAAVAPGTAFLAGGATGIDRLDLATGEVMPVRPRVPRGLVGSITITRAGVHWLEGHASTTAGDREVPVIVNRTTGRVIDTDGSLTAAARGWGAGRWIDLSRTAHPEAHLCAPIRRVDLRAPGRPRYGALLEDHAYTLRETTRPAPTQAVPRPRARWILQRCATRTAVAIRTIAPPVLGAGHLVWVDTDAIHLRTLATGRTRRYALPTASEEIPILAMSSDELVVSSGGDTPHAGYRAFRIPLR